MKIRFVLPLALLAGTCLPACGDKTPTLADAKELANLSPENAKAKATEMLGAVTKSLNGITDLESAKSAVQGLTSNLDVLSKLKSMIGDKMPDLSSLGGVVTTLKEKFAGKTDILSALGPIFEKIKALLG
ncbi:MAG: hypothetical protein R3F33_09020 [Planctomycetota bacterium]